MLVFLGECSPYSQNWSNDDKTNRSVPEVDEGGLAGRQDAGEDEGPEDSKPGHDLLQ